MESQYSVVPDMVVMSNPAALGVPEKLWRSIELLHYGYPAVIFAYFLICATITICTLQTRKLQIQDQHVRRDVVLGLLGSLSSTYVIELFVVIIRAAIEKGYRAGQDRNVYLISSFLVFLVQILTMLETKFPVWYPYYGTWFIGIAAEITLIIVPNVLYHSLKSPFDFVVLIIQILRVFNLAFLPIIYFGLRNDKKEYDNSDAERQSLLSKKLAPKPSGSGDSVTNGNGVANGYGATDTTATTEGTEESAEGSETAENSSDKAEEEDDWLEEQRKDTERLQKRLEQDGNWWTYAKGFSVFLPHLWPVHDKLLQLRVVFVVGCLFTSNLLNIAIPLQFGRMVDSITDYTGGDTTKNIWLPVILYGLLKFVSSQACIGWLRKWLWLPVEQYSKNSLSTASHAHLMNLSSDFHDSKSSSDLSQAMHGGSSVLSLVETVCFELVPMFNDLGFAFIIFWTLYGPYMGLLITTVSATYLYATTKMIARRQEMRRQYITNYRREWTVGQESLDGWITASLFNMIPYEKTKYGSAVKDNLQTSKSYEMASYAQSAAQALVMAVGMIGALLLGLYQVAYEGQSIGRFTTLLAYWAQLQSPLAFFSSLYRSVSYSLMDAERMLELFQTKPTITDGPDAKPLKLQKGLVKFENVSFAYDERKPTLKSVSFSVPEGRSVALVGETGGGKSTILKLIDRFYDVKSGCITIDGQDIRKVTLSSLRGNIGVVPQDPVLFNDTVMNNIRYARLEASDKEVHQACKAAAVHDKIMSFPDGYNSKVGDRGVKLSGGEKQRVAIARAILKQPEIILLDEATSAVDTETEQLIQEGLGALCKNRTTFIVAHRLSTVMRADHVVVIMNGEVVEQGSHNDLIHSKGKYYDLWSKQLFVMPSDVGKTPESSKKDADIVNDLSSTNETMELGKAIESAKHEHEQHAELEDQKDNSNQQSTSEQNPTKEFKLKNDAPEFVSSLSKTNPTNSLGKTETKLSSKDQKEAAKAQKEAAKEQKKKDKEERKANSVKQAVRKIEKHEGHSSDIRSSTVDQIKTPRLLTQQQTEEHDPEKEKSESNDLSSKVDTPTKYDKGEAVEYTSKKEAPTSPITGKPTSNEVGHPTDKLNTNERLSLGGTSNSHVADKTKHKRRYSRRHLARSEPANRTHESMDGAQESDVTPISSGEGYPISQLPAMQRRRVSAPSDPPAGPHESRGRNRRRHWRLKHKFAENRDCQPNSLATSGDTSTDTSPLAPPLPSPADSAQPSTPVVRFAPGS